MRKRAEESARFTFSVGSLRDPTLCWLAYTYTAAHITTRSGPSPYAIHPCATIWSRTVRSIVYR